jgi:hypothetical protein
MTPVCRVCGNPIAADLLIVLRVSDGAVSYVCRTSAGRCWATVRDRDVEAIGLLVEPTMHERDALARTLGGRSAPHAAYGETSAVVPLYPWMNGKLVGHLDDVRQWATREEADADHHRGEDVA